MATAAMIEQAARPNAKPTGAADRFVDEAILDVYIHEVDVDVEERDRASRGVRRLANTGSDEDAGFAAEVLEWLGLPAGGLLTRWPADGDLDRLAVCLSEARAGHAGDGPVEPRHGDGNPGLAAIRPLRRGPAVRPDWRWQDDANCIDAGLAAFFGPDGERQPERDIREHRAKAICSQCPVRRECGDHAMGDRPELYGLWAGLGEDERARERRRRMRRAADRARESVATDADDEGMDPVEAAC